MPHDPAVQSGSRIRQRLARGVFLLGAAKVLVNGLALVSTFVLARLLTPDDFGLVAIATTILSVVGPVTELSLSSALVQQKDPQKEDFDSAWTMGVLRGILLFLLFALFAPLVADHYGDARLLSVMFAIGVSVLIGGCVNPKVALMTKQLDFWPTFVVAVGQKIIGVVVGLVAAYALRTHWALLLGTLASQAAGLLISFWQVPYKPAFSLEKARSLLSFSVWLTLGQVINTINWRLDHMFVAYFQGARALGVYVVGDNLAAMPTREVIGPIEQTLFPGLVAVIDEPDRLKRTYQRAQALITAAVLPVGLIAALNAEPLVLLVLGGQWREAIIVVQGLAAVFAVQTLGSLVHPLAMAMGQTRMMFFRDLFAFVVRVPIIVAGAWMGGLSGIVYARVLTGLVAIAINIFVVKQMLGLGSLGQLLNSWRSLLSAAIASLAFFGVRYDSAVWEAAPMFAQLLAGGILVMLVYCVSHFCLWVVAGKPVGPESEIFSALRRKLARFAH